MLTNLTNSMDVIKSRRSLALCLIAVLFSLNACATKPVPDTTTKVVVPKFKAITYKGQNTEVVAEEDRPNAVLRTATIYVKDLDASLKFYNGYLGYEIMGVRPISDEKSLKTIGAGPGTTARIAYLKPINSRIQRPFSGNYLGLIEVSSPNTAIETFERKEGSTAAVFGEVVLAHQVVGIDTMYEAMVADKLVIIAPLSLSGTGASRSYSVFDPNGIRIEIYEYVEGKEPLTNP